MSSETNIGPATFLELIHGAEAMIYFQVGGKTWKNKPQTFAQAQRTLAWRNAEGEGICFVVNGGGTRDADVTRINACFLDWDAGRGADGKYLDDASVIVAKSAFQDTLKAFSIHPSILVETRNGFHAYWLLDAGVSVNQFRDCQRRLARHLGGDPVAVNPARLMRLPGYDWTKVGYARFHVRVVSSTGQRFDIGQLLTALPALAAQPQGAFGHHNNAVVDTTTALIVVSKRQDVPLVLPSMSAAIEHLKAQDLGAYLRVTTDGRGTAACPFHADANPSATVAMDVPSGHWLFYCHSSRCGVKGSIIDLTMRMMSTTDTTAVLHHLMRHFNVQVDTGWRGRESAILDANIAILDASEALREQYPSLYRWIGRVAQDLTGKLRWAKALLVSERLRVDGRAVFFMSLREMERRSRGEDELPRQFGRQSQRVDRYCLLGLMRKLPDGEIPAEVLADARTRQGSRAYRIQFYSFPAYTDDVLRRADERARRLITAGASVRGVSRKLATDVLGAELAGDVYPQRSLRSGGALDAFTEQVETVVLEQIANTGYATVNRVRSAMAARSQSLTHRRIERVLPGVLSRNGLTKVTANAEMKRRFAIGRTGYPKLIVPCDMKVSASEKA